MPCDTGAFPPARSFEWSIEPRHPKAENIISTFETLGLQPPLLRAVRDLHYDAPTPVQAASIPPALAGNDLLASAATGSGKTAAFGLPILNALLDRKRGTTRALILVPTRELALQISQHLSALAKHSRITVAAILGGVGFARQIDALQRGTDVIVATPGRLLDILAQGKVKLTGVELLVLDEADRMLDMGFLPVVRRIVKQVPSQRQTLLFSATIPPEIATLTKELLRDPVRVNLAPQIKPVESVTQFVYTIAQEHKTNLLVELLKKDNTIYSAIVFTRTKARANRLALALSRNDVTAERIHGDRSQSQRTHALESFKRGKYRVLVATDIAARGIDIADLGHVVNYDVPAVPEDYVHRVGRTARAEKTGDAITFVSREEEPLFAQIERSLGRRLDRAKTPHLPETSAPVSATMRSAPGRRTYRRGRR